MTTTLPQLPPFTPISDDEFAAMAKQCREYAEHLMDETGIIPHVLCEVFSPFTAEITHQLVSIVGGFNEHVEKNAMLFSIGKKLYEDKLAPRAWFLICEAWIAIKGPGRRKFLCPADDPERREAIIYHGVTLDGRNASGRRYVQRDAQEKIITSVGCDWVIDETPRMRSYLLTSLLRGYVSSLPYETRSLFGFAKPIQRGGK